MPDLENLITEWRKSLLADRKVSPETVDELEDHLRENMNQFLRSGMTKVDAFKRAVEELGAASISAEFQKLERVTWLPMKLVTAIAITAALAITTLVIARFDPGRSGLLLASHVLLVMFGYTATFLVGALGICFVAQRSFAEFRLPRSLPRVTFIFGCVALASTAAGAGLGMVWANAEWGRYWNWDAKESGAFVILLWQACFVLCHRFGLATPRRLLVSSLIGNIVVALGWFGANLVDQLHGYPTTSYLKLLAIILPNVAFFLAGFAPAGWLRFAKIK
jgi:Cytochrome C assembly protein